MGTKLGWVGGFCCHLSKFGGPQILNISKITIEPFLPCEFSPGTSVDSLQLNGNETFDIIGLEQGISPQQNLTLVIHRKNGDDEHVILTARLDTPVEVDYYRNDGILPYVLRGLLES